MFIRRFSTVCSIALTLGERAGRRRLQLHSRGFLDFAIGPRTASSVVDLQLVDAEANLDGFTLEVDGKPLEIAAVTLTGSDFDTASCRGEVDQHTQEGWFRLVFTLTTSHIPALRSLAATDEARIEIVERGKIDISRGRIVETHAEAFELPPAIPRTLIASVGSGANATRRRARNSKQHCAVDTVRLAAELTDEFQPSDLKGREKPVGDLIVCPGTSITLIWGLSDVGAVKKAYILEQKSGARVNFALDASGLGTVEVTPADDAQYVLKVDDPNCAPASDIVTVWVVKPGKEITIHAQYSTSSGKATWDGNPKLIGKGVYATSIRSVDCGGFQSPPVPVWDYAFTDIDGRVTYGEVQASYTPLGGDLPLHGCHWEFAPKVVSRDFALAACFKIRCACH